MKGIEAMIANMLGITPQSMHETLSGFQAMILSTKETLERIEGKQDEILTKLEGLENVGRDAASGSGANRNASGGRQRGSRDIAGGTDAGTVAG